MALSDWNPFKPFVRSREEVAWFLESALNGTLNSRDWDTFLRIPIKGAPDMEAIRAECERLEPLETTGKDGILCHTAEAQEVIRRLLERIKK